jgi:hypothetical protein
MFVREGKVAAAAGAQTIEKEEKGDRVELAENTTSSGSNAQMQASFSFATQAGTPRHNKTALQQHHSLRRSVL